MNIEVARAYAQTLLKAANKAESEGRNVLTKADMENFSSLDDAARSELQSAIDRAEIKN